MLTDFPHALNPEVENRIKEKANALKENQFGNFTSLKSQIKNNLVLIGGQSMAEQSEKDDSMMMYERDKYNITNMLNEASTFNCGNIQNANFSENTFN